LQLASAEDGKGDALIAVKQPYAGAVPRNQHNINRQVVSIIDFLGDDYDGTTDAAPAFVTAHAVVPKGQIIYVPSVPSSSYLLNSNRLLWSTFPR
jgi:hypothetical protein